MKSFITYLLLLISASVAAETPNVVLILCDDLGYNDPSIYGSKLNKTPHIDSIGHEGLMLSDFYSPYSVCSASRASLLTGSYAPRLSMPGVIRPKSNIALHPDEITLGDLFKSKGYKTGYVGKWHVGDHVETLPTAQGFDSYYGIPYSNDMNRDKKTYGSTVPKNLDDEWIKKGYKRYHTELYRDLEVIESPVNQVTLTDRYTDETIRFIEENKQSPFFTCLAFSMPHIPLYVSDKFYNPDPKMAYNAMMNHLDYSVGRVLTRLKELELDNNTIVIFTSDNGPWLSKSHHGGNALPLKSGKRTTYEGGQRVPFLIKWPKRIPASSLNKNIFSSIDLFPTFAELLNYSIPTDKPIDGHSFIGLFDDPNSSSIYKEKGYYFINKGTQAVRMGKWKFRYVKNKEELYDLETDIAETKNLADQNPERVDQFKKMLKSFTQKMKNEARQPWRAKK